MENLLYTLTICVGLTVVVLGLYFLAKNAWDDVQEHDIPTVDFGALEGDMQNFVTELNNTHRKDAA